jgi:hypothetical protein
MPGVAEGDDLTAKELAAKYVAELEAWVKEQRWPKPPQESALFQWERWISDDPERAWPVFIEIVALRSDDETLDQVACRLRLLLWQDFEAFHERTEALVRDTPRFAHICGEGFFDPERYREHPLDVEQLIRSHEEMSAHAGDAHALDDILRDDPRRALALAIEIIHRGPSEGLTSFDTFDPLRTLLWKHGPDVIDQVEESARHSYLVRRVLWRMIPGQRARPPAYGIAADLWPRVLAAQAGTTDFTDDTDPQPAPRTLASEDEQLLKAWFTYQHHFWSFDAMSTLVSEEPETAWAILLEMLRRAGDEHRIGALAAGPLEDLLGPPLFDRIAAEARTNPKLRQALSGVWINDEDEIRPRYVELMTELGLPFS